MKAINPVPIPQLAHSIRLLLFPSSTPLGLGGQLKAEGVSTLKPARKPWSRGRILGPV